MTVCLFSVTKLLVYYIEFCGMCTKTDSICVYIAQYTNDNYAIAILERYGYKYGYRKSGERFTNQKRADPGRTCRQGRVIKRLYFPVGKRPHISFHINPG